MNFGNRNILSNFSVLKESFCALNIESRTPIQKRIENVSFTTCM